MSTACHPIHDEASLANPNVVKVVLDAAGYALYFSRSRIPYPREAGGAWYRHAGIYAYRAGFLQQFSRARSRARWSRPRRSSSCARSGTVTALRSRSAPRKSRPGVDTPQDLEAVRRMLA